MVHIFHQLVANRISPTLADPITMLRSKSDLMFNNHSTRQTQTGSLQRNGNNDCQRKRVHNLHAALLATKVISNFVQSVVLTSSVVGWFSLFWLCLPRCKDFVLRFIIEYSSLRDFPAPTRIIILGLFLYEDFWKMIFWLVLKLEISYRVIFSWRILDFLLEEFFEDYMLTWWNIWVSIILLLLP
jgi:hypothetical protein